LAEILEHLLTALAGATFILREGSLQRNNSKGQFVFLVTINRFFHNKK